MADFAKGKTIYNSILNRWIFGTTADNKKSAIFKEGYDDPTYMTFKIEFGDWGASILKRSLIQGGITEFALSFNDYDQLPMGLLNCPYEGMENQEQYWQTNAVDNYKVFNKTKFYSAFQYLRSRNEDTRAKYLYYFVNGLYELQHDYPFIFKKISGLNGLEKIDYASGQRLKTPAKISVECYEGLDLKIRTLFEFYRKAAWDDVYQRWILPENMREFKMIIYVFERRVFQDTDMFTIDGQKYGKLSFGKLNADIPVKAYECMPCEFDISESMSWNDSYSSSTENNEEQSKLVINVKNVKTYFKNNLFNDELAKIYNNNGQSNPNDIQTKIDSIMIYDLVEEMERNNGDVNQAEDIQEYSSTNFTNLTVNGAKAMFLDKRILLENEEGNLNIKSYIWGHSAGGGFYGYSDEAKLAVSKSKQQIIKISEHDTGHEEYQQMVESYADYMMLEDNEFYRGGWGYSLASVPTYNPNKSFWGNLGDNIKNVLTGTRRLMLISGGSTIQFIPNCLIDSYYIPFDAYSPISDYNNGLGNMKPTENIKDPDYTDYVKQISKDAEPTDPITSRFRCDYTFKYDYNSRFNRQLIVDDKLNEVNEIKQSSDPISSKKDESKYGYKKLELQDGLNPVNEVKQSTEAISSKKDESKYGYKNLELQDGLNLVNDVKTPSDSISSEKESQYDYQSLQPEREIPSQSFVDLKDDRSISKQVFNQLDNVRDLPQQYYESLEKERELSKQDFRELDNVRNLPIQYFEEIEQERKLVEQDFRELDNVRELREQDYKELEKERELKEQKYKELEKERNIDVELMDLLLITRSLPGFKNMSLEDIRKIPKQDLLELKEAEERSVPIYNADKSVLLESIKNIEGSNMKLLELDKDNKTLEEQALEMLKQNQALSQFKISETAKESPEEKANKLKGMLIFTQDFVQNHDKIKKAYAANIMEMKSELKNVTKDIVNKLPINDTYIVKKGEKDHNNINSALMSQNDIDQINRNMKFLAINDNDIEKLSFQTLITIQDDLTKELQQSKAVVGLTDVVKDSVATHPNKQFIDNAKKSVIEEPKKNKINVIY